MKFSYKQTIFVFLIAILLIYNFEGCKFPLKNQPAKTNERNNSPQKEYDGAITFLYDLRNTGIDTVIFQQRVCIGCCEFFNIFWASNGNYFLKKFHADYPHEKNTEIIRLMSNEIFKQISYTYDELKKYDVNSSEPYIDHFCYTQIRIFTKQDSLETPRIYDSNFDKDEGYMDAISEKERNEKYLRNLESKWNILLTTIENQLANMTETKKRELNSLRIKRLRILNSN